MTRFLLRRLGLGVLTILLASVLVFAALQALPGDVAGQILGRFSSPEARAALTATLNLDQPPVQRYLSWLGGAVQGDFGTSLADGRPVVDVVWTYLRNSLLIAAVGAVLGIALAFLLGIVAGTFREKLPDNVISVVSLVGMSVPEYTVATLLVLLLSVSIPLFPAVVTAGPTASLSELLPAVWLPGFALAVVMAAYVVRITRSSVIDVLASDFAVHARLRGLSTPRILVHHVLPSAILPTLNVVAVNMAWLFGGVVVVEAVFNYPGLGTLVLQSVSNRDLPVLQLVAIIGAVAYVLCNLLADLGALALNPRLRTPAGGH
ncbi:ABC transporter permease [Kineococcus gynurae]|uniref:ABC transporter permease n=1 Tax=Kineococcus gynurae TaxID=452979 RepID=A0ABV5LVD7_9ACTN